MKEFFLNLMSSSTLASTKRFLIILFGFTMAFICVWEVLHKEYVLPTTTLAGLIYGLADMNRRENILKMTNDKPADK